MAELSSQETRTGTALLSCQELERAFCEIWSQHFGRDVLPHDNFYDLGGDSLAMIDMVLAARERGIGVRSSVALRNPTPARLAETLALGNAGAPSPPGPVPPPVLRPDAHDTARWHAPGWSAADCLPAPIGESAGPEPLYVVHSDSHVEAERNAVAAWCAGRPARGFPLPGTRGPLPPAADIAAIADRFTASLLQDQPTGACRLAGFGDGAVLALEMARRLRDQGRQVPLLVLVKPPTTAAEGGSAPHLAAPGPAVPGPAVPDLAAPDLAASGLDGLLQERLTLLARRFGLSGDESLDEIHARMRRAGWYDATVRPDDLPRLQLAWAYLALRLRAHDPAPYDGPVLLVQDGVDLDGVDPDGSRRTWDGVLSDLSILRVDYGVRSPSALLADPHLAATMRKALTA